MGQLATHWIYGPNLRCRMLRTSATAEFSAFAEAPLISFGRDGVTLALSGLVTDLL